MGKASRQNPTAQAAKRGELAPRGTDPRLAMREAHRFKVATRDMFNLFGMRCELVPTYGSIRRARPGEFAVTGAPGVEEARTR